MSEYRVEQSDDGWYVMRRGACWASCSDRADAERIARALAVLDAMEEDGPEPYEPLSLCEFSEDCKGFAEFEAWFGSGVIRKLRVCAAHVRQARGYTEAALSQARGEG